jgi:hypothetical protein
VIATIGPVGDGLAFADADADADAPADEPGPPPPSFTTDVVLVQAASASARAAAPPKAEPIRICLMSELFPTRQAQNAMLTIHPG